MSQEILNGHVLFLFRVQVQDDLAFVHHDGAVAQGQGVLHVMGDHEGGEVVFLDQVAGKAQHLFRSLGVQGGGVLVQEEELRLLEGGHEQGQGLALSAGQEAHLAGHPGLQTQIQGGQLFLIQDPLLHGDAPAQAAVLSPAVGQGQVFLNVHGGGGAGHGILEDAAQEGGALMLRQVGDIPPAEGDGAVINLEGTGDGVEHGALAGAVAADDRNEIALVQGQVHTGQRHLAHDGAGVEGFPQVFEDEHFISHGVSLPSASG